MASRNLDEALIRLDNTIHSMTLNMDKLLNRLALVPSSTTPNPTPVPCHSTSVPAQIRYASSPYEDPVDALFKLTQTGSVPTYLKEFEDLANRIIGLMAPFLLSCFISGLTPEIRRAVQAHQPMTVDQATGLAKL